MTMRLVALVALALMGACSNTAASKPAPTFRGTIRLGVGVSLTGPGADAGSNVADGALLAAEDINADGGLLGRRVEVVVADDQGTEAGALDAAHRLVGAGVVAVVGHLASDASLAAAPVYAASGLVQVAPTSMDPRLTQSGLGSIFRICPTWTAEAPAVAQALVQAFRTRVVVVVEEGSERAEDILRGLSGERRPEISAVVHLPPGTRDVTRAVSETVAVRADATVLLTSARTGAAFVTEARRLGADLLPLYGPASLATSEFVLGSGPASEGATVTAILPNRVAGQQANTDLIRRYRERFGRNPGYEAPAGYVAASTYFEGVRKASSFAAPAVAAALHAPDFRYDSMIGVITYDAHGDLLPQRFYPQVVREGRLEPA